MYVCVTRTKHLLTDATRKAANKIINQQMNSTWCFISYLGYGFYKYLYFKSNRMSELVHLVSVSFFLRNT